MSAAADMTVMARPEVVQGPRGRWVEKRACGYCWATFTQKRVGQDFCSSECSKRNSVWNSWVHETRRAAMYGLRGPALPAGGRTLVEAVAPAQLTFEAAGVAA